VKDALCASYDLAAVLHFKSFALKRICIWHL